MKDSMILIFDTNKSQGTKISLPLFGEVNVVVNWGDGDVEEYRKEGTREHIYEANGVYTVEISGKVETFGYYGLKDSGVEKLIKCLSFGNLGTVNLRDAFFQAINLIQVPVDFSDTVKVISFMFQGCVNLNQNIRKWDLSNIDNNEKDNMLGVFAGCVNMEKKNKPKMLVL